MSALTRKVHCKQQAIPVPGYTLPLGELFRMLRDAPGFMETEGFCTRQNCNELERFVDELKKLYKEHHP